VSRSAARPTFRRDRVVLAVHRDGVVPGRMSEHPRRDELVHVGVRVVQREVRLLGRLERDPVEFARRLSWLESRSGVRGEDTETSQHDQNDPDCFVRIGPPIRTCRH